MSTNHLPDCELTPPVKAGPVWHTYVEVDGQRLAESTDATTTQNPYGPAAALTHAYFHLDDQGTISLVTTDSFNASTPTPIPQNELSDVFGQPRLTTGATDPSWGANDVTKRRYINQEDLTDAHLIDLNARVYDPLLGKFLSPDPVIANQDDSQSWNAYAYSHNNPMSKEDPTGRDPIVVGLGEAGAEVGTFFGGPAGTVIGGGAGVAAGVAVHLGIGGWLHNVFHHQANPTPSVPISKPNSVPKAESVPSPQGPQQYESRRGQRALDRAAKKSRRPGSSNTGDERRS
jgi:RHS repeat-associated protein